MLRQQSYPTPIGISLRMTTKLPTHQNWSKKTHILTSLIQINNHIHPNRTTPVLYSDEVLFFFALFDEEVEFVR